MKNRGFARVLCVLSVAIGSLVLPEHGSAKSRKTARRQEEARVRSRFVQLGDEQLREMMEYREREISDLWPQYTEAYPKLCAAIAATRACTNSPTPAGPPTITYDPVMSGHGTSPMYLAPGKVYQLSEASPAYRRIIRVIAQSRAQVFSMTRK